MSRLRAFLHLDFVTVKPYLTVKTMLIYAVLAVFLMAMLGNIAVGMGVGMMIGIIFTSYPFALCEKSNLDALYATLAVSRKTVVLGRYVFSLLLNLCAIAIGAGLCTAAARIIGAVRGQAFAAGLSAGETLVAALALFALGLFVQAIQLPLYFRLGYNRAKVVSFVPFIAILIAFMAAPSIIKAAGGDPAALLAELAGGSMALPLLLPAVLALLFVSYRMSHAFYRKREF